MLFRLILIVLGLFILYVAIGSILPNVKHVNVSDETKKIVQNKSFTAEELGNDRASIIDDPTDALNLRLELVRKATESIDIVMYKVMDSQSTKAYFGEVYRAAERGVEVNVLVNGLTYLVYCNKPYMQALNTHPNITCRIYNPVNLLKPKTLQILMHDKIILVDDNYLLVGGRNVDERHFQPNGFDKAGADDLEVFVVNNQEGSNSVTHDVRRYIHELYDYKLTVIDQKNYQEKYIDRLLKAAKDFKTTDPKFYKKILEDFIKETVNTNKITLIHNPINAEKKEPILGYQLKELALKANKAVTVQTPYVTGNEDILNTFQKVAEKVDLIIQTNSLASTPNYFGFSNYYGNRQKIVNTGVNIYEYQSYDSVHNKSITIDDRLSLIGTFNMDDRSLHINSEVMLVVDSQELTVELLNKVDALRQQSSIVTKNNEAESLPVSFLKKILIYLFYILLRPLQFLI